MVICREVSKALVCTLTFASNADVCALTFASNADSVIWPPPNLNGQLYVVAANAGNVSVQALHAVRPCA